MDNNSKPLSEATDIEEFKRLRYADRQTEAPAESAGDKATQGEEPTPASASDPGTEGKATQEPEPAEKSVEDQIKELRAKGKHAAANKLMAEEAARPHREEAERLRKELEGLRTQKPEPKPEATAKPATTEAAKPDIDPNDPEPKPTDEKYAGEEGYTKYLRDCGRWDARQEQRAAERQRREAGTREAMTRKLVEAKAKYPDFDTVTAGDMATGQGLILTPAMIDYVKEADSLDVMYFLGKNPSEYQRIFMLPNARQIAELGKIEDKISAAPAAAAATPEPKKPAVSKVSAPPRVMSGNDAPEPKSTAEARSFEEFKRIRHAKAS